MSETITDSNSDEPCNVSVKTLIGKDESVNNQTEEVNPLTVELNNTTGDILTSEPFVCKKEPDSKLNKTALQSICTDIKNENIVRKENSSIINNLENKNEIIHDTPVGNSKKADKLDENISVVNSKKADKLEENIYVENSKNVDKLEENTPGEYSKNVDKLEERTLEIVDIQDVDVYDSDELTINEDETKDIKEKMVTDSLIITNPAQKPEDTTCKTEKCEVNNKETIESTRDKIENSKVSGVVNANTSVEGEQILDITSVSEDDMTDTSQDYSGFVKSESETEGLKLKIQISQLLPFSTRKNKRNVTRQSWEHLAKKRRSNKDQDIEVLDSSMESPKTKIKIKSPTPRIKTETTPKIKSEGKTKPKSGLRYDCPTFCKSSCTKTHHELLVQARRMIENDSATTMVFLNRVSDFYDKDLGGIMNPSDCIDDPWKNTSFPLLHYLALMGKCAGTFALADTGHDPITVIAKNGDTVLHTMTREMYQFNCTHGHMDILLKKFNLLLKEFKHCIFRTNNANETCFHILGKLVKTTSRSCSGSVSKKPPFRLYQFVRNMIISCLQIITEDQYVKLNLQDCDGCTVAHYIADDRASNDLIEMLKGKQCDFTIKDKVGNDVYETICIAPSPPPDGVLELAKESQKGKKHKTKGKEKTPIKSSKRRLTEEENINPSHSPKKVAYASPTKLIITEKQKVSISQGLISTLQKKSLTTTNETKATPKTLVLPLSEKTDKSEVVSKDKLTLPLTEKSDKSLEISKDKFKLIAPKPDTRTVKLNSVVLMKHGDYSTLKPREIAIKPKEPIKTKSLDALRKLISTPASVLNSTSSKMPNSKPGMTAVTISTPSFVKSSNTSVPLDVPSEVVNILTSTDAINLLPKLAPVSSNATGKVSSTMVTLPASTKVPLSVRITEQMNKYLSSVETETNNVKSTTISTLPSNIAMVNAVNAITSTNPYKKTSRNVKYTMPLQSNSNFAFTDEPLPSMVDVSSSITAANNLRTNSQSLEQNSDAVYPLITNVQGSIKSPNGKPLVILPPNFQQSYQRQPVSIPPMNPAVNMSNNPSLQQQSVYIKTADGRFMSLNLRPQNTYRQFVNMDPRLNRPLEMQPVGSNQNRPLLPKQHIQGNRNPFMARGDVFPRMVTRPSEMSIVRNMLQYNQQMYSQQSPVNQVRSNYNHFRPQQMNTPSINIRHMNGINQLNQLPPTVNTSPLSSPNSNGPLSPRFQPHNYMQQQIQPVRPFQMHPRLQQPPQMLVHSPQTRLPSSPLNTTHDGKKDRSLEASIKSLHHTAVTKKSEEIIGLESLLDKETENAPPVIILDNDEIQATKGMQTGSSPIKHSEHNRIASLVKQYLEEKGSVADFLRFSREKKENLLDGLRGARREIGVLNNEILSHENEVKDIRSQIVEREMEIAQFRLKLTNTVDGVNKLRSKRAEVVNSCTSLEKRIKAVEDRTEIFQTLTTDRKMEHSNKIMQSRI